MPLSLLSFPHSHGSWFPEEKVSVSETCTQLAARGPPDCKCKHRGRFLSLTMCVCVLSWQSNQSQHGNIHPSKSNSLKSTAFSISMFLSLFPHSLVLLYLAYLALSFSLPPNPELGLCLLLCLATGPLCTVSLGGTETWTRSKCASHLSVHSFSFSPGTERHTHRDIVLQLPLS